MNGPSLVVWGGGGARLARARAAEGGLVVAWPGAQTQALVAAGVSFRGVEELLGEGALAASDGAARSWARVWPRLPLAEGRSLRELALWRGESLLWTTESFLRTQTIGPRCVRTAELSLRLLEALRPGEIDSSGLPPSDALLLSRAATACGVLFHGAAGPARPPLVERAARRRGRLRRWFAGLMLPRGPRLEQAPPGVATLLFLLEQPADRTALGALLGALAQERDSRSVVLQAHELSGFETRRVRRAVADAERRLRACLRSLRGTPAVAASYVHRGVGFADLAGSDLEAILLGRLPQAVRRLECASELLQAIGPALLVLAVEERDERRSLGLAAAAAGVPWVALRLGAADADEPDRDDGGPHPAFSLAFSQGSDPVPLAARLAEAARDRVRAR